MIGLGRMGANMARRLMQDGHRIAAYDVAPKAVADLVGAGAQGAASLEELVQLLTPPRAVWCMLPAGDITEHALRRLGELLSPGDILIDGGNTFFKDDIRRAGELANKGIVYLDVGTSGGVWGAERGYCLMVGGPVEGFRHLEPVFASLAPGHDAAPRTPGREGETSAAEHGYLHCGPVGSGHYVKMVHNGIEYGLMQAYAEGMDLLRSQAQVPEETGARYELNLEQITEVWRRGSVIGSWLLDLSTMAFAEDPNLSRYTGYVPDSGEGRWTVQTAVENAVHAPVLTSSLYARFRSRQDSTFADRTLSAMREKFGGHKETSS
ncbi:phosphogluconate dehydrogenase (NAD(+)-dependent, decarboxylating) [Methylococcus sp. EFPC2]|uniref:phosphogluconate dehydrogenase (NAD(+)-dependent, decarboxylating) n=1 Tax=Methylococcus sp. EFPC2 TaxID=2812648 RepID=UPI001F08174A|nr:decarboxylating 6-phosphogluconate dehydrogenase [Methylococcus sp. EFPC2]